MSSYRPTRLRRRAATLGLAALLAAVAEAPAAAAAPAPIAVLATTPTRPDHAAGTRLGDVRVLAHFDRAAGQAAESIAPEPGGGAVIGMIPARQVVRVAPDGAVRILATMPLPPGGGGTTPVIGIPVVTGVARSDSGAVYFLYSSGQGGLTGVWQVRRSGEPRLVVPLPADTMPNALVIDGKRDRFLITDSTGGRIWQAPLRGGEASVWSADPALAPGAFFGANGLKTHDGAVWASNSDHGTIVRIPVTKGGGSGRAEVRATGLEGIDDFDFTGRGTEILAAINQASKLVRVGADGAQETMLDAADGMQGTTAVAVRGNRVYVTNGANLAGNDPNLMVAELQRR
jgi:sugar lactone lactonase YvrE